MPAQYEAIRDSYIKRSKSTKTAKRIAAQTYISKGRSKSQRSALARSLHSGR